MTVTKLHLLSVPVSDQARAKDFYVGVLGMKQVDGDGSGAWIEVQPRDGETSITFVTWFDTMPAGSLRGLVLRTDDLEADISALRQGGVDVSDMKLAPWGTYVEFNDPDGNGLVLVDTARTAE